MALLAVGDKAPAFSLKDQEGNETSLTDFQGRKLLLYFYPKADTPGCTKQACSVRDAMEDLADSGVTAVGVSPDVPDKQKKFDEKYGLGFPLLSDPDHETARAYGAWGEKKSRGKTSEGIVRSHFAVDPEGRLTELQIQVKPQSTAHLALRLIQL